LIVFASAITDPAVYDSYAAPGIRVAAEPGSEVLALEAVGNVARSYNLVLDAAAERDGLEALVLVEEHVEIADPALCAKVRAALSDPAVAVAGWMGATGVTSIAWWDGRISCGPVVLAYQEHGGGELPVCAWTAVERPPHEVYAVDGRLLALSPWAVRELRFDEQLGLGFGHDFDFCLRAREAGRKIVTADIAAVLHNPLELVREHALWVEAHIRMAEKWDGRVPGTAPVEWRQRARRAEAERDAARTLAYSNASYVEARARPLERELAAMTASRSWRLTAPLRRLNELLGRRI
jgi:hypothetical protein